ncbi:hypothetical protein [Portibacter marinus]|uniref:hypothetical protein n=1 Tax=Portibacter marinus TaxID=2898660 RepID=UPI001F25EE5F|nr:hypothetical protein [Portibacter marinus]
METTTSRIHFNFKLSDLLVQPLAYKSIAFLEELVEILQKDIKDSDEDYQSRISFIWAFQVKEIAILFRDTVVNLLKLEQYVSDGIRSEEELENYQKELYDILESATNDLEDTFVKCEERNQELNSEWEHQFNPAPAVILQVEKLINQIKTIQRSQLKLDLLTIKFEDYRSSYLEHMNQREDSLHKIEKSLVSLKSTIESEEDKLGKVQLNKIDNLIETLLQKIEDGIVLAPYQFIVLEDVDKLKLAVGTAGGHLIYKSVDVLSEISGWTSFNLASPLKTIDTKIQAYKEKTIVGLIQVSNRIKAKLESANGDEVEVPKSEITAPVQKLISEYREDIVPNALERLDELKERLVTHIRISQLFNNKFNFLPSSAIGQLTGFAEKSDLQRRYSPGRIRSVFAQFFENLFSTYSEKEQVTAAAFIKDVISFDTENDANALFLKSGFLGSSFSVKRTEIIHKVKNHFELWREGYGGGLLIKGGHLSGRSTVLEMLPINYPEVESYHVVPGQKIDVKGHKRAMGDDLIDTLNFIIKYKGPEKCMVTIDDLNYYADHPEKTFEIFAELNKIVSKHSKKVYFAIVVHKYLYNKLSHYFNIADIYTETVNTDFMTVDQIQDAVLTRAHAVVNNDDMDAESETLASISRKVAKKASGNVGKAMQLWCMYTNGKYSFDTSQTQFRKLVENHHALLKLLIMHGWVQELEIRNMFNAIDANEVRSAIKGLVQIRLLERPKEGFICINPYLVVFVEGVINRMI